MLQDGPFPWTKEIQGQVLGSFFYGYLVSQIPSGLLAEWYGARPVLIGFLGASTIGTLLTPLAAQLGYGVLIFVRIIVGIGSVSYRRIYNNNNIIIYSGVRWFPRLSLFL